MRTDFVSIIIIFLNTEKFLAEAVQSVLDQSYEDWELLLVDDGSTDGSTLIAHRFAEKYPERVRYLEHAQHQNRGMSAARNLGLYHSTGEYITFLDADDTWTSNALEDQVSILRSHPEVAMVYGPIQYWYSWAGSAEENQHDYVEQLGVPADSIIRPPTLVPLFLQDKAAVPSGMLIRREIIDRVGGFEESFRSFYEDQVFCAKVCLAAPVYAAGECWYRYRQHPDASCSVGKITGEYYSARHTFLNWLADYLVKQKIYDPEVWQALRQELMPFRHPIRYQVRHLIRSSKTHAQQVAVSMIGRVLPVSIRRWLAAKWQAHHGLAPVGWVNFGSLRRITPISRDWGFERGLPIDRYYLEHFLSTYKTDIQGHVLEILDDTYTRQFGGDRVTRSDVLHVKAGNPEATLIADLACADDLPANTFDCIIITQTIHLIYDMYAAIRTLYRIMKPGGVLLVTVPGISQISRYDMDRWGDYWRFTTRSIRQLFEEYFPSNTIQVASYGNVLAATAFLYGLAAEELRQEELNYQDPDYQLLITAKVVKPFSTPEK